MKVTILALALGGMLGATQAAAQSPVSLFPIAPVVGVDLASTYLFRGVDVTDAPALQPWATVGLGNTGLSAGVWSSFAVADRDEVGALDEVDLTAAYNRTAGPVAFGLGYIAYIYPSSTLDYTTQEVFGTLGLAGLPLTPALSVFWDFDGGDDADDNDVVEGVYASLGVTRSFPIGLPLDLGANIGWTDQDALRSDPGFNDVNVFAGIPIPFQRLTVTPTVGFTHLFEESAYDFDGESSKSTLWAKIQLRLP
jgi:uncharacterized protein (TIGR02001 family)